VAAIKTKPQLYTKTSEADDVLDREAAAPVARVLSCEAASGKRKIGLIIYPHYYTLDRTVSTMINTT
jgi:hypothetical protein